MNDLLRPYLRRFVLVFFDDILVFSSCVRDHLHHLQIVFQLLQDNKFYAKAAKCVFAVPTIQFLGHVLSATGVEPDLEKLSTIAHWPTPTSLTTLRVFLGLTGFYRHFIRHYASLAAPLTDLLKLTSFVLEFTGRTSIFNIEGCHH
uniref:Retrovirus-related Pol polyprotein from transposon 17.6 n=2 Tax=Cajanus cajan TaxID=3821 RepID=A0A151S510_CAJCA|nr:Retrovirus-related Pol polyprotein from transposon 17.6 [Cajanus cajan]